MEPIPFNDSWVLCELKLHGFPLLLRYRGELMPLVGHPRLPNRLQVIWIYDSEPVLEEHSGMPSEELSSRMADLENALADRLEPTTLAVLISVATNAGRREWTWYGGDRAALTNAINEALANADPYPIQLKIASDPTWSVYTELLRDVGNSSG